MRIGAFGNRHLIDVKSKTIGHIIYVQKNFRPKKSSLGHSQKSFFDNRLSYLKYQFWEYPSDDFFRLASRLRPAMLVLKQGTRKKSVTTTTDVRRTYDGQKHTPLIVGAPFSFWSFFYRFWTHVKFFGGSRKKFSTKVSILIYVLVFMWHVSWMWHNHTTCSYACME